MADVTFERVSKVYDDGTRAVRDLELEIGDGEFMVLVGPSGCGKTTALRMVAGLEEVSEGVVRIGERVVNHVPSRDRDIAMVFQSYALYPHLSVYENIAFGLRVKRVPKDEISKRVEAAARTLDLEPLLARKPRALSGGQRQRVALGRAIVREPQAYLMDEPLSNLDAKLRVEMREYVEELHRRLDKTIVYVTHDQVEAMTMGDRVAVLRDGRLEQVDEPQALYDRPASLFVAAFMGSPAMNLLRGRLGAEGARCVLELGSQRVSLPDELLERRPALIRRAGEEIVVGIRPEALSAAGQARPTLEGEVKLVESLGSEMLAHVEVDAVSVRGRVIARLEPTVPVASGERIALVADPKRFHFFDPKTERALD